MRVDPLWCTYVDDQTLQPPQVAFALSRALGTAVQRNLLRRRLRAILERIDVPSGSMLIGADRGALELTFDELTVRVRALVEAARRA